MRIKNAKRRSVASPGRGNVLRIRLTEAERKELDEHANKNTLETSTWARMELLRIARTKA